MEEVWKDMITLSSSSNSSNSKEESHTTTAAAASSLIFQDFLSRGPPFCHLPTLNHPVPDYEDDDDDNDDHQFHVTNLPSTLIGNKRLPELTDANPNDRRHKRMIKNRESAARSRARKQAYTNELELEIAHLTKENARLKLQLCIELAAGGTDQAPKKNTLQRTSTAPF